MEVIYWLIPAMLVIGLAMVGALFWAVRTGQYEDMEGPAHRILLDEEEDPLWPATEKSADETKNRADKRSISQK